MGDIIHVPHELSFILYSGIGDRIEKLIKAHEGGYWSDNTSQSYLGLRVALDWYTENCVLSSYHLEERYKKLSEAIEGKYFLYDYYKNYRFTLRYDLGGITKEEKNRLVSIKSLPKKAEEGLVFKFDGLHVRIVNVYPNIDEDYGSFIAESLTITELLKMRKGEN
ncbi:hypothetical protein [Paenibacillus sp. Mc5Re-14]|uniref:hypothetical protein n=1 Tax=Paenibacillus sp. Mc5Re-14 TaxID=1030529 RepID=UPI000A63F0D7|nr:hypothetical protein [Paenibacillus sp. Mc5Re-14]